MYEITADLWRTEAQLRVITTNGFTKKNGAAVMGRGCAKEAVLKYGWETPYKLGDYLLKVGNFPFLLYPDLATLPVKHNWWEDADLGLIVASVNKLVALVDLYGFINVVMPRPGCGNGKLNWQEVQPAIADLLDNRFTVVDYA